VPDFRLVADFKPTGDQPAAIEQLSEGLAMRSAPPDAAGRDRHGQDICDCLP